MTTAKNNIIVLIVVVLLIYNLLIAGLVLNKTEVSGKSVDDIGRIEACIVSGNSYVHSLEPTDGTLIIGTVNVSIIGENIQSAVFSLFEPASVGEVIIGSAPNDGDTFYNITFDSTTVPDVNCRYSLIGAGLEICGTLITRVSQKMTVDNIPVAPTYSNFSGPLTTNFSNFTSWSALSDAVFENAQGYLNFTSGVNLDNVDMDTNLRIDHATFRLNIEPLEDAFCLSAEPFRATFYNITEFVSPAVARNGAPCLSCTNIVYDGENFSFSDKFQNGINNFTLVEAGNLTANLSIGFNFLNKSFDNSPTFTLSTYIDDNGTLIPAPTVCAYKTDYDPLDWEPISPSGSTIYNQSLRYHNMTYIPTNLGRYDFIQHYDYFHSQHTLYVVCNGSTSSLNITANFTIVPLQRDRVYYSDGDEMQFYMLLEEPGLDITIDLSEIDSNFNPANVGVTNIGQEYNISYNITSSNTRPDGQYNITIEARNSSGFLTMNGSIFSHLINNFTKEDIDNAFDCWNFKQGYYFDEVACDWESDLNHMADRKDLYTIEVSCFDNIDNDYDGETDINDTDCPGIYYVHRRALGIDSAFLIDPCYNNVCELCLGGLDSNNDGDCDTAQGTSIDYLDAVQPGQTFRIAYDKASGVQNKSLRVSINFLNETFNARDAVSSIEQLPVKELGGCVGGVECKSLTGTTFNPPNPDEFTPAVLDEKLQLTLASGAVEREYPEIAVGVSISGNSAFQQLEYLTVNSSAIINESDNPEYCFDSVDNDLNDDFDCNDLSCVGAYAESNSTFCYNGRDDDCDGTLDCQDTTCDSVDVIFNGSGDPVAACEFGQEHSCDDGFDNDDDGFIDCLDNDCFHNSTACPATELVCNDTINNDYDWGEFGNAAISLSYESRGSYNLALTDCLDVDCDEQPGNPLDSGDECQYAHEDACTDSFDNDADGPYDCIVSGSFFEIDCDRFTEEADNDDYACPLTETVCNDGNDNDLDYRSLGGTLTYKGDIIYGGIDCQDLDCNGSQGGPNPTDICEYGDETICDDGFDNDGDSLVDCADPSSCQGLSGAYANLTGLCRPCPAVENISIDSCSDGKDNDGDGNTDCSDTDCENSIGPGFIACNTTTTTLPEALCADLIDNDGDGQIDYEDSDCITSTELLPGLCSDGRDNDNDGDIDCADSDCSDTKICIFGLGSISSCTYDGYVGGIEVCHTGYLKPGENMTVEYTRESANHASIVLKAGNVEQPLTAFAPLLDDTTTYMFGTTTNFVKVNDTYGVKAQNDNGFSGNLNLSLLTTIGNPVTPGYYPLFISTSFPGVYGEDIVQVYVAENEAPTINSITTVVVDTNVTIGADVTDAGTYNTGIAYCSFNITDGASWTMYNRSSCILALTLSADDYNVTVIAYDGSLNPSAPSTDSFTTTTPYGAPVPGPFYNPYSGVNYPTRWHFNDTERLNIGVTFTGFAFDYDLQGCAVELNGFDGNGTFDHVTEYVELDNTTGDAVCRGQIELENRSFVPFSFTVTVNDTNGVSGSTNLQGLYHCYYTYTDVNDGSTYDCADACLLKQLANTAPILISSIPNQTVFEDSQSTVIDLDDYFFDAEGDALTFTFTPIDFIDIFIDFRNFVTIIPQPDFFGNRTVTFFASDPFTTTPSNVVSIEVLDVPESVPPPASGGGGGGGGGGSSSPRCNEKWVCEPWEECLASGYQRRKCSDMTQCRTITNRPPLVQECQYSPTCNDLIRNQNEIGVDCGGPCAPCPTCFDGVQNQGEQGIDCGGPCGPCETCFDNLLNQDEDDVDCGGVCDACPTCSDGIRNQGEVLVDCGGPCPACPTLEQASLLSYGNAILLFIIVVIMTLLLLMYMYRDELAHGGRDVWKKIGKFFLPFKRRKEEEENYEDWLRHQIELIEEAAPQLSGKQIGGRLYKLIHLFFHKIWGVRYQFTLQELAQDVKLHKLSAPLKRRVITYTDSLIPILYSGHDPDKVAVLRKVHVFLPLGRKLIKIEMAQRKRAAQSAQRKEHLGKDRVSSAQTIILPLVHLVDKVRDWWDVLSGKERAEREMLKVERKIDRYFKELQAVVRLVEAGKDERAIRAYECAYAKYKAMPLYEQEHVYKKLKKVHKKLRNDLE